MDAQPRPVNVIVGAAGGIGSKLCYNLAARGAKLVLAGRTPERLEALAADLREKIEFLHGHEPEIMIRPADATRSAEVESLFADAVSHFGRVDGAVNLCGSILLKPAHLTTDQEFADTLTVNLTTAFNVLRAAAKAMTGGGSVVLMSSVAGSLGLTNHEAIAAAKGGVEGMVRAAAATYAPRGLRVNAVAPGLVKTPLAARITGSEAALKASTAMHPLGRVGEPGDVASAIDWLLHPTNTWVTGQVLAVDGGMSTVRPR